MKMGRLLAVIDVAQQGDAGAAVRVVLMVATSRDAVLVALKSMMR